MAKKSSNNAVKKLDKQIKDLENSIKEDKSETLPVLDKKKIEEEQNKCKKCYIQGPTGPKGEQCDPEIS